MLYPNLVDPWDSLRFNTERKTESEIVPKTTSIGDSETAKLWSPRSQVIVRDKNFKFPSSKLHKLTFSVRGLNI